MLRSSRISRKLGALIVRCSQKKDCTSFVFSCFENPSVAHNFGTLVWFRWGFQQTSPNEHFNQKLKMSHVILQTDFPRSHHIYDYNRDSKRCAQYAVSKSSISNYSCSILVSALCRFSPDLCISLHHLRILFNQVGCSCQKPYTPVEDVSSVLTPRGLCAQKNLNQV